METTQFTVNGKSVEFQIDPQTPLLWALREQLGLTGTKFGCGMALCGACTVHVDGDAVRSCVMPLKAVAGKRPVFRALGYRHYARMKPEFVGSVALITGGTRSVSDATVPRQRR